MKLTTVTITVTVPSARENPYAPMEGRAVAAILTDLARELRPLNLADSLNGKQLRSAQGDTVGTYTAITQEL